MSPSTPKSSLRRVLAILLVAAAGAIAPWGQSNAAVIVGAFDPAFGESQPKLGFRGSATFFVPNACLALSGTFSNSGLCAGMTIDLATLEFYDSRLLSGDPHPLRLESQTYVLTLPQRPLLEIVVGGGKVIALQTSVIGPEFVSVFTDNDERIFSGNTWLQYYDHYVGDGIDVGDGIAPLAYLFACSGEGCSTQTRSIPGIVTFTQVPEPGTVGLVLAGLAMAVFAKRRRS